MRYAWSFLIHKSSVNLHCVCRENPIILSESDEDDKEEELTIVITYESIVSTKVQVNNCWKKCIIQFEI